jgi:hypothetical protein
MGTIHGQLVVDHTIERLTAKPAASKSKTIFMGATAF